MDPFKGARALRAHKAKIIDRIRNLDPGLASSIDEIRLDWYSIRNAVDESGAPTDTTEVFIYDEIGGLCGMPADTFIQELSAIETPNIVVRINSPGGSLFDSIAIHNALVTHPSHITTQVDALAASGASIIAMAGDSVVMMVGAQMMIHDALGMEAGNARDFRQMADFLDRQSDNIATIYTNKAGGEPASWRAMMLEETWLFANEAVDLGLADSVYVKPQKALDPSDADQMDADEQGEPNEVGEAEMTDELELEDIEALMTVRHRVTNRGYKFNGRNDSRLKGPRPSLKLDAYGLTEAESDDIVARFAAHFSNNK